jgi:hypothetical protein
VAALVAGTGVASAEPTAADKETARGLMADGRAARDRGDLRAALKAFTGADNIMHVPTTGLELARTQAALGQLLAARDTTARVMRFPERPNEPAPFKVARDAATSFNEELDARIPSLKVLVTGAPEGARPRVTIDGASVPAEQVGQARKVDPGHHVIVARAGSSEGKQEIDLAEKESKQVSVDLSTPATAGGEAASPPADQETSKEGATASQEPSTFPRVMVYGGFGLAGAGLLAGTITGAVSLSKTSGIRNSGQCSGDVCGPVEYDDISSAKTMATLSTVSFIVAGVGAVAGVVGLLMSASSAEPKSDGPTDVPPTSKGPQVEPWIGLGAAGLRGRF